MAKKKKRPQKSKRHTEQAIKGQKTTRVQSTMIATVVVIFLIVVGFVLYESLHNGGQTTADNTTNTTNIPNTSGSTTSTAVKTLPADFVYNQYPMMGRPNAPVKIVEFGDYRCPYCKAFDLNVFPTVKKDFIDKGKADYYFVNFPFLGQGSVRAAIAAQYVYHHKPDAFWKYHEALYHHQGDEHTQWATAQYLTTLAVESVPGIKGNQLLKAIQQQTYLQRVEGIKQMAINLGVNSTPTIYVNGKKIDQVAKANMVKVLNKAYKAKTKG